MGGRDRRNGAWQEGPPDPTPFYGHTPHWTGDPEAADAPPRLGTTDCEGYPTGGLAEVAVYPYVLSEDGIGRHYQAGAEVFG